MTKHNLTFAQRFWMKVDVRGPGDDWLWTAARYKHGYGKFGAGGQHGATLLAHRVAYELTHGPIPDGLQILHSCDVRACCNPAHMSLGTQQDNLADMRNKGRQARGASARHKLTAAEVAQIRALAEEGRVPQRDIGQRFGVAQGTVSAIKRGVLWSSSAAVPVVGDVAGSEPGLRQH